jgi:hypothetical protein
MSEYRSLLYADNVYHSVLLYVLDRYVKLHNMCVVENGLIPEDEECIGVLFASLSNALLEQRDALYSHLLRKLEHLRMAYDVRRMALTHDLLLSIDSRFKDNISILASYRPINTKSTSEIIPLGALLTQVELSLKEEFKRLAKRHLDTATSLIDDLLTIVHDYSD